MYNMRGLTLGAIFGLPDVASTGISSSSSSSLESSNPCEERLRLELLSLKWIPGKEVPVYGEEPGGGRSSRLNKASASVLEPFVNVSGASVMSDDPLEPSESVGDVAPDWSVSSQVV
jgi:hypothetical protein